MKPQNIRDQQEELNLSPRRFLRSDYDSQELVGLIDQPLQFLSISNGNGHARSVLNIAQQFQPKHRFVGFFFDCAELRNKLSARSRAAGRTVIGSDRTAGAQKLIVNVLRFGTSGQFRAKHKRPNREATRPVLQLCAHCKYYWPFRRIASNRKYRTLPISSARGIRTS